MTAKTPRRLPITQRISGPGELLQAVPYLLGFHPRSSLVLVGLHERTLVVTARLDLDDAAVPGVVARTVQTMEQGGSSEVIAAIYDDDCRPPATAGQPLPWSTVALDIADESAAAGCPATDVLLVSDGRWWSYLCAEPQCCPPEGQRMPDAPSAFAAAATYSGVVALPDRESLATLLEPPSGVDPEAVAELLEQEEHGAVDAVLEARRERWERSAKRALFAAARAADELDRPVLTDPEVARFGVALGAIDVRDAVWMAIDDERLDGRELWRELARRLPTPYDAAPLFLFGWASWRRGDGALARVAADRAVASDPSYSAADLLLAALAHGVDPRRMPKLRLPRPA